MKRINQFIQSYFIPGSTERRITFYSKQLALFGYLQSISCIFPLLIFISLALSSVAPDFGIPRYDLLLVICLVIQFIMYKTGFETRDELLVITMFHLLGLIMEVHKVYHGSWSYPEEAYSKIYGVPLYSGFMYASVGSYICQSWRNMQLETVNWPKQIWAIPVGAAIYINFITNVFIVDLRLVIAVLLLVIFWKTRFVFILNNRQYQMPAIISFLLIGFFIWIAENIATFFGAWQYAYQHAGWQVVDWHKLTSWSLLVIVSIIIVGELKKLKKEKFTSKEH